MWATRRRGRRPGGRAGLYVEEGEAGRRGHAAEVGDGRGGVRPGGEGAEDGADDVGAVAAGAVGGVGVGLVGHDLAVRRRHRGVHRRACTARARLSRAAVTQHRLPVGRAGPGQGAYG